MAGPESEDQNPDIPEHLRDIASHMQDNWDNPLENVANVLFEQSGILPHIAIKNPEFAPRLTEFLVGGVNLQIIGGESGMGKSIVTGEIRDMHTDLNKVVPVALQHDLAVISYDRTHEVFFIELNYLTDEKIKLPQGETHIDGRRFVSGVLRDQVAFVRNYFPKGTKIIVETPLIDSRGEVLLDSIRQMGGESQVFIMHSPESRNETLEEGRDRETSGQKRSMLEIRDKLLYRIAGSNYHTIPDDVKEVIILNWWKEKMNFWDGLVLEMDPNDNREGYSRTKSKLITGGIYPDEVKPALLDRVARSQFEHLFDTITDFDEFVKKFIE